MRETKYNTQEINMKYEILTVNDVNLVIPAGKISNAITVEEALKNNKPFCIFGIPEDIKSYIKSNTDNYIKEAEDDEEMINCAVTAPYEGTIIQTTESEINVENEFKLWNVSCSYPMTEKQAEIFKSYFPEYSYA